MMEKTTFPDEWLCTNLGSIVEYGKAKKCSLADIDPFTWVLELEDIEKESSRVLQILSAQERPFKSTKNIFNKGNVLYGKLRPYLNKVIIATDDGVCTTEVIPLNAEPFVDNRYIFYWLKSEHFLRYVTEVSYGVNMPRLGTKDGIAAPFILPPLAEQKIIADKLDSLLAQVETTKARLDRIPDILKRFRQSVLAAAVSGRLTEEWRKENKELPKVNLESIQTYWNEQYKLADKRVSKSKIPKPEFSLQLPESWVSTQVGYVFDTYVGSTPSRSNDEYWNGNVPWVSSSEVAFCRISSTKEKITDSGLVGTSTNVHPAGTVMLAMIGQGKTRGQAAILDIEACHNQNTAALRIPKGYASSEFLYFFLTQQYEETRQAGGGNNQKALNKSVVQSLSFPLPPYKEQTEIVRRVEELFAFADAVEQKAQAAAERVNKLTQSILAKAFRGDLTKDWRAANPDLISGENSAEALLEKIKAEREAIKPKKKTRAKKVKA